MNERKCCTCFASKRIECKIFLLAYFLISLFAKGYAFSLNGKEQNPLANHNPNVFAPPTRFLHPLQKCPSSRQTHVAEQGADTDADADADADADDLSVLKSSSKDESKRRAMIKATMTVASAFMFNAQPSSAGLVQFPCTYDLMNTYHFMRAGESLLESEDIISSNPLFLTNREDALSSKGLEQVELSIQEMLDLDINPSVVKYSLAAKSMDTANIVATQMQIGRNRLIPEYTFMDPRGLGSFDRQKISVIENAVWAMDHAEAGKEGREGLPPPTDDGTPNETLHDQAIRLRQLMSILETQFSGDTIVLIFPDGTGPALLSALIAGISLNRVHELNFSPGEVRLNITVDNIKEQLKRNDKVFYDDSIAKGRVMLKELREHPDHFVEEEEIYGGVIESRKQFEDPKRQKSLPSSSGVIESRKQIGDPKRQKSLSSSSGVIESRKQIEDTPRQKSLSSSHEKEGEKVIRTEAEVANTPFFNFLAVSVVGLMTSWRIPRISDGEDTIDGKLSSTSRNEVKSRKLDLCDENKASVIEAGPEKSPELDRMEHLVQTAPIEIPEIEAIKFEQVGKATEEYLDQDESIELPEHLVQTSPIVIPEIEAIKIEQVGKATEEYLDQDEGKELEHLVQTSPIVIPEIEAIKAEKVKQAEKAMEEYLDQDDGSSAWLDFMSSMIEED